MMPPTTFRLRHAAAALALGACLTGAFAADEFENKERELNGLFRRLQDRLPWVDRDG